MPDARQKWLEFAERHIKRSFSQGHSAKQVVQGLKEMLQAFKKSIPNTVYNRTREALLRKLRCLGQRQFQLGDKILYGKLYGIVFRNAKKRKGRATFEILIVGPTQLNSELGKRTGWQMLAYADQLKPYPGEFTQEEQAIIDNWQQWAQRQASHIMPREPIKRNYDYSGNYLDRVKRLQKKKKKRKATLKHLRVLAGRLRKKAVKEYFDEQEIMELLSAGLPDLKIEKMPGEKRDFPGVEGKEIPFAYGEIPNYINPADDMAWDVIVLPSTWGCTRDELMPVGILRYNRDVDYWDTFPGDDPIGNDKILLGKRGKDSTGDPRGEYTKEDLDVLTEHFKDTKAFESPNLIWDYV